MAEPRITYADPEHDPTNNTSLPAPIYQVPAIYQPPPPPVVKLVFDEIKKYIAPPEASDEIIQSFMLVAEHCGLDPFLREIYLAIINNKPVIMTGYQTYIKRAERTQVLLGWNCEPDDWEKPTKATLTIHRRDWKIPFTWTTLREEVAFVQTKNGRYERPSHKQQPAFQLVKCCIKQGFSVCFASEVGGLPYIPEELPDADGTNFSEDGAPLGPPKPPAPLEDWKAAYFAGIKDIPEFADESDRRHFQLTHTGKSSVADMDKEDMNKLFAALDQFFPEGSDGKRRTREESQDQPSPQADTPEVPAEETSEKPVAEPEPTYFNQVVEQFSKTNDLDSKYLYLYLCSRFLIPALDEHAEAFLTGMRKKPGNIKSLKEAVLDFTKWANAIGTQELMGCITDLHYYSSNLDEENGAAFLKGFFTSYAIKADRGLYKIWDIPSSAFGTWKFVLKSMAQRFGFADEDEIDEREISDDENIPEDVPEADPDIPF